MTPNSSPFAPGCLRTLSLTVEQTVFDCKGIVLKSFLPFTKSQVMLVDIQHPHHNFQSPVVLKVYDPRFINDREKPYPSSRSINRPWSLSLEIAAEERRNAIARNERPDDYDEERFFHFDELFCEEYFYRSTNDAFNSELDAYARLRDLQSKGIARPYAHGNLIVEPSRPTTPALCLAYWHDLW